MHGQIKIKQSSFSLSLSVHEKEIVEGNAVWFETISEKHREGHLSNDLGPGFIPPNSSITLLTCSNKWTCMIYASQISRIHHFLFCFQHVSSSLLFFSIYIYPYYASISSFSLMEMSELRREASCWSMLSEQLAEQVHYTSWPRCIKQIQRTISFNC